MKAILLAAGRGSRLKQLTEDKPKCLVNLNGLPLLEWQLRSLHLSGISEIAIVTGYQRGCLASYNLVEFHNPRWAETNMVSSLACAESWLMSGPCLVSYTDIFYQPDALNILINTPASLAVTFDPNWKGLWEKRFGNPLLDAESFRVDTYGNLLEIGKPPILLEEIQGQYMGLLRFTPDAWREVQNIRNKLTANQRDKMDMTGLLQRILEGGAVNISALPYYGLWSEIDSQQDLSVANEIACHFPA